jgi:hypothetical protein
MNLQQVISSGKNYKRSSNDMWLKTVKGKVITTGAMLLYELNSDDILADDWEIEEEVDEFLSFDDDSQINHWMAFYMDLGDLGIEIQDGESYGCYSLDEKSIDKILTFLYNNTEIGKSRITPF